MIGNATQGTDDNGPNEETNSDALPVGTVLLQGQYTITRYIRSGGFGIAYLAKDSLDRDVILKECFIGGLCERQQRRVTARNRETRESMKQFLQSFVQEARRLSRLSHPNIVKVHQVFEDNDTAYMALEYVRGRDLLDLIEAADPKLSPSDIITITVKLLHALDYIHRADLLHGDIAPDNILLDEEAGPVLIDFGAARQRSADPGKRYSGFSIVKDGYSPHELYINGGVCGPWSDLYALAATMYHAIAGSVAAGSQSRLLAMAEARPDPCPPLAGRIEGFPPAYLESLDTAMNVKAANRFQSARAWLDQLEGQPNSKDATMKLLGKTIRLGGTRPTPKVDPAPAARPDDGKEPAPVKPPLPKQTAKGKKMAINISGLKDITGFIAGCVVDTESGLIFASEKTGTFDIEAAGAANVEVVRAKFNAIELLGLNDSIEDILITLGKQLHLIRPLEKTPTVFMYVALDKKTANLGLARMQLKKVEQTIAL